MNEGKARHVLNAMAGVVLVLAVVSPAFAKRLTVWGPETFTRANGQPVTATRAITIPNFDAGRDYYLRIRNGPTRLDLVTAATVTVGGVTVFAPRDFAQPQLDHLDHGGIARTVFGEGGWSQHPIVPGTNLLDALPSAPVSEDSKLLVIKEERQGAVWGSSLRLIRP